jgi:flagellar motor protein MotB
MIMKIATSVLTALLLATLGVAAVFYLKTYQPMAAEHEKMKSGMTELDKAKTELKKYREKESRETAWLNPAIDILSAGLSDEIKAGKAEVLSSGNIVVVNIAEDALYIPGSHAFLKENQQLLRKLDSLLRDDKLKGKQITVGNTTQPVPAQSKGRKKIPARDARTLAADRSAALIQYLEKSGVNRDALIAAAYSSNQPEIGFKLKAQKTVIIIGNPPEGPTVASKREPAAPQTQPQKIPIRPALPKAQ